MPQPASSLPSNHLLALARRGTPRWRVTGADGRPTWADRLYPLAALSFAALVPIAGSTLVLPLLMVAEERFRSTGSDAAFALVLVLGFLPIFLLLAAWLRLVEGRPLWTLGLEPGRAARRYGRGLAVGLALMTAAVGLLAALGQLRLEDGGGRTGLAAVGGVMVLLVGWAIQGAAEEALTRGFLLPVVGVRWGLTAGVVVSSTAFAALHAANSGLTPLGVANLVLFGVFACAYALHEGGLWGVCAIHSVWNWAQGNLYGLEVSGAPTQWSMVVDLAEKGPDWLTGGPFGPEGGLAVTLVLLVATALVVVASVRARAS